MGITFCHPRDQFVKAIGRKMAFGEAVKSLTLDRAIRRAFWEVFKAAGGLS